MSSKMQSSNNIAQARRTVQQLRIEANIERIKVSKASADLMHYCNEHAKYDPLLMENNFTRPAEPALMKYSCSDSFTAVLLSPDDSQS